jgi:hypothetical protein
MVYYAVWHSGARKVKEQRKGVIAKIVRKTWDVCVLGTHGYRQYFLRVENVGFSLKLYGFRSRFKKARKKCLRLICPCGVIYV